MSMHELTDPFEVIRCVMDMCQHFHFLATMSIPMLRVSLISRISFIPTARNPGVMSGIMMAVQQVHLCQFSDEGRSYVISQHIYSEMLLTFMVVQRPPNHI
ncbi:hypothetical protein CEXT_121451 [Caerostris extrusa]|uniref:Uncharacterized protein n=1 Tax=Caerostris extrusa TaxID=172846 RepID=A0AAV4RLD9_CAEEX|nr:hypothetical protein CEXT_121451 [Caerostris extrusa]